MTMSGMTNEEMPRMMREMMEKMFANMTPDDKTKMLMGMMGKLKEGINMEEMMPKVMMAMMSKEEAGGMREIMAKMRKGGEEEASMMPEMMLKAMMPHCIKMMMPAIGKDKRPDLVSSIVSALKKQATIGMSDEEQAAFVAKIVESVKA